MTKLRFYFILCKDEETLLRADETDVQSCYIPGIPRIDEEYGSFC